jgi:drug/metabolite transporter (DMT)-like permease
VEQAPFTSLAGKASIGGYAATDHRTGLFLTATGGLLFTFDVPLVRLAQTDPSTLIFARGILLAIAITVFWAAINRYRGTKTPFIAGTAGIVVAITNTLANTMFLTAVNKTTAANLVFILALNPVFCALLAWFFLKEKVHHWTWLAIGLSFVGVGIIVWDGLKVGTYVGDLLAVGVALCTAIALTVVRHSGKNVITSLAIGSLVSALIVSFWAAPASLPLVSWGWIAINGLIVIPLAAGLIAIGPRYLPAPEVAMFFLLDVVFTPIWIWLIFQELPTIRAFIGGLIIFLTLVGHSLWRFSSSKTNELERPALLPHG